MTCYVDTSALAKLYHDEAGSERMRQLYDSRESIQVSELAQLELLSVIMRKLREGVIGEEAVRALQEKIAADVYTRYELLPFSPVVVEEAARVITSTGIDTPLRTLDAIQFAFYNTYCSPGTPFVCADQRLLATVIAAGKPVLNPAKV